MANIRLLKKDIDYLMSLVLEDCIFVLENNPEADREKVMGIAQQVIFDHRKLRDKVSHRQIRKNPEKTKKYLSSVVEEMYEAADKSLDELSDLISKNTV
jgi:hypothetical protein